MGWMDVLTAANFRRTTDGATEFYPWGPWGQGCLLPDEATSQAARRLMRTQFLGIFVVIFASSALTSFLQLDQGPLWILAWLVPLFAWHALRVRRLTRGLAVSPRRLGFMEAQRLQWVRMPPWLRWVTLLAVLLMFALGVWLAVAGGTLADRVVGALLAGIMVFSATICLRAGRSKP